MDSDGPSRLEPEALPHGRLKDAFAAERLAMFYRMWFWLVVPAPDRATVIALVARVARRLR